MTAELKAIHFHDLYPTYTLHDLVSHPAIIMLPYSVMSYKLTEFYALSIPIFVPSPKFYRNNSGLRGVNFINILWAAFSLINFLTSIKRETINNTTQCAKDCGPYNRACEYGRAHLNVYAGSAMFVRSRSYKTFFSSFSFFRC